MPPNDLFSDIDEPSQSLLGGLPLEAEDEPARRGAASRANSVRFDESALHGSSWGQGGRHSGDYGLPRPTSGMGGHQMMERSFSHKSDGRHSSAGHSVHSVHSGVSGRASSLGLDTNFMIGGHEDDDSPIDVPEPPPGFFYLGSAPSIIRCWLTTSFTSTTLLYAAVCTGSQKSTVDYSLIKDLQLENNIHRDVDGVFRIRLPVFLAEARVTQSNSRSTSPLPQLPSITCLFEVSGFDQPESPDARTSIRVFIGSHTLRLHSADLLLSQNLMTLYGNDRDKLSVPFVRPEDDQVFKNLTTCNVVPGKPKLNATAPEFVSSERPMKDSAPDAGRESVLSDSKSMDNGSEGVMSPGSQPSQPVQTAPGTSSMSESGEEGEKKAPSPIGHGKPAKDTNTSNPAPETNGRREPSIALRTPWRQTVVGSGGEGGNTLLSGYQPAARPRSMKVLRPSKPGSSASSATSGRTGSAFEPAQTPRSSSEYRRKGDTGAATGNNSTVANSLSNNSWGSLNARRSVSSAATSTTTAATGMTNASTTTTSTATTNASVGNFGGGMINTELASKHHHVQSPHTPTSAPRSANNPLGSASAFSWIKPSTPAAAIE